MLESLQGITTDQESFTYYLKNKFCPLLCLFLFLLYLYSGFILTSSVPVGPLMVFFHEAHVVDPYSRNTLQSLKSTWRASFSFTFPEILWAVRSRSSWKVFFHLFCLSLSLFCDLPELISAVSESGYITNWGTIVLKVWPDLNFCFRAMRVGYVL